MNVAWLVRIDGVGNYSTAVTTKQSFDFDGTTYAGGIVSVSPPNERSERADQWVFTIAAQAAATRNDILAQGAPAEIELELIHDAGSGWVSAGVVAAGQLTAPVLLDDGNWRVLVDTSPGDADRGDPLMWNSERATGMSRLGPESESIVLRWPPGE